MPLDRREQKDHDEMAERHRHGENGKACGRPPPALKIEAAYGVDLLCAVRDAFDESRDKELEFRILDQAETL
jgi:hypothetical protein